jgi:hypothetical protein
VDAVSIGHDVQLCINDCIDLVSIVDDLVEQTCASSLTTTDTHVDLFTMNSNSVTGNVDDNCNIECNQAVQHDAVNDTASTNMLPLPIDLLPSNEEIEIHDDVLIVDSSTTILSDELENSFEIMNPIPIDVRATAAIESIDNLPDLFVLRQLISQIEDDVDADDDDAVFSNNNDKHMPSENESISDEFKPIESNRLSTQSSVHDVQVVVSDECLHSYDRVSDDFDVYHTKIDVPVAVMEPPIENSVVERSYSMSSCHSIPSDTNIIHMSCSSTYMYICSDKRQIFYAKIDLDHSFHWEQHTDLADRLAVSLSNRAVWRLYEHVLYASHDSCDVLPIGSRWSSIEHDGQHSILSMSVNDQCGW